MNHQERPYRKDLVHLIAAFATRDEVYDYFRATYDVRGDTPKSICVSHGISFPRYLASYLAQYPQQRPFDPPEVSEKRKMELQRLSLDA